jgi:sugar phosphate isomerase/epimerase
MKLVTTTDFLARHFGFEKAIDMIADAGYDGIDFSAFCDEYYTDFRTEDFYTEMRRRAEDRGVFFLQAHAPMPSSYIDPVQNEHRFAEVVKAMRHAALLGAKTIVVHPYEHLPYRDHAEELVALSLAFYRRLLPYAEKYGIRIATEAMWDRMENGLITHSVCAHTDEMIRIIDEIGHPLFGACVDVGHTVLVREDTAACIRALGKKRLFCLHIHDVDGAHDNHTLPYFAGGVSWERVLGSLAEIGYEGNLTFEADGFFEPLPQENAPDAARFMERIGRTLIRKFEEYQKKN